MTERRRAERRRAEIDWKFYKKVFWLALPIALQSLITIGVNMLDTIMVGNLGEMSLSAVSLANQFIGVYQIFCMGLGMGASVLVSRYWGMQEAEPVKSIQALRKTICIVVRITVSLALLFAVVTLLIPQVVMRLSLIHISEPTRRTPISYAVFCLKKKKKQKHKKKKKKNTTS